ncbi:HAD family hydrolase [Asanoa ishikariensis]|uniref:HAD family hydrolase n=1 Tax=Asanoa ishikariensis TaxID=137265 RepID=UPI000B804C4D|nr:HAD-IA family hydrolase [Asanoa ishikariensis]
MPALRAVVFDFFGTLTRSVHRGPEHLEIARILGCDARVMVSLLDATYYRRASGELGSAEDNLRWIATRAGADPSDDAVRAALDCRFRALCRDTELRDEAVPVLWALRLRGLRTALISDCTHELPALLPGLAVAPLLDIAVFSVEEGVCKPDPSIYLAACQRLGVAPAECLYVGDGGSHELTGAAEVGMTAVRLAAPDLADHLVFAADVGWCGRSVTGLVDVLDEVDRGAPAALPGRMRA